MFPKLGLLEIDQSDNRRSWFGQRGRPNVSGKPFIRLKFCTATPDGSLEEIVGHRDHNQPTMRDAGRHVTVIRVGHVFGGRKMIDDAHEWLAPIEGPHRFERVGLRQLSQRAGVHCAEDSSIHRHQVRRERGFDGLTARMAQDLVDLRLVPVIADRVRGKTFVALAEQDMQLGHPPCAR